MNKIIISLFIITFFLISCTSEKVEPVTEKEVDKTIIKEEVTQPVENEEVPQSVKKENLDISSEELDELKSKIEKMQVEDLSAPI